MKKFFKNYNKEMILLIWSLAWPTMLEQAMQTAVQYIDTAMVGTLGTQATAAVGATSTVNWLVSSTVMALGIGFLAYIAKSFGAQDKEAAKKASAQALLCVLVMGTCLTVITTALSPYVPVWMQVDPDIQSISALYFFILYAPMLPRTASMIFGTVLR
ncbi:MAG: MATE family efflux transporter, partial [Erysipelotrichaceae bacterium]|nr:MATE family efflux transporter [Erysipelotrichaceae bacterium]